MTEVDVDWKPPVDLYKILRSKGASQGAIDAAGRIKRQRQAIEDLRAEDAPPIPWLASRSSQLATFYSLLSNWYDDRSMLFDCNDVDYSGGET